MLHRLFAYPVKRAVLAVNINRGGIHEPLDARLDAGIKDIRAADDILLEGFPGRFHGLADIGDAGQMIDVMSPRQRFPHLPLVQDIADDHLLFGPQPRRRTHIEYRYAVSPIGQGIGEMTSEKAGPTDNDDVLFTHKHPVSFKPR